MAESVDFSASVDFSEDDVHTAIETQQTALPTKEEVGRMPKDDFMKVVLGQTVVVERKDWA